MRRGKEHPTSPARGARSGAPSTTSRSLPTATPRRPRRCPSPPPRAADATATAAKPTADAVPAVVWDAVRYLKNLAALKMDESVDLPPSLRTRKAKEEGKSPVVLGLTTAMWTTLEVPDPDGARILRELLPQNIDRMLYIPGTEKRCASKAAFERTAATVSRR